MIEGKPLSSINYIDDEQILSSEEVNRISEKVIRNFWKISGEPPEKFKLDINVVSDSEIKKINKEYLNRDRPTDVIAFSLQEGEWAPDSTTPLLGQIVISRDSAIRQAARYSHSVKDEMILLLVHGLLHVAGWEEGEEIQKCQTIIKNQIITRI